MSRLYVGLIALMSFFAFQADWNCNAPSNPPPTKTIKNVSANNDPLQWNSPGLVLGCAFQPENSPMLTWHVTYTDNTSANYAIYWPTGGSGGGNGNLGVWFAPPAAANVVTQATNAVNAWNAALTRDVTTGGTININLSITSDYTAPVRVYSDNGGNLSPEPDVPGAEAFGAVPAPYSTLASAEILLMSSWGDITIYDSALHEFGHALGLAHNHYETSVMFPQLNLPADCITSIGQLPLSADTYNLEVVYDPHWTQGGSRCGKICPQGPSNSIAGNIARIRSRYPQLVNKDEDLRQGKPFYVHLDDHSGSQSISTESLYLSSTLVAQVDVLGDARYFYNGPIRTVLKMARVKNVLRHLFGPDERITTGEVVYVADLERADGESFIDDPALVRGVSPVVFLRRTHRFDRFTGSSTAVYEFTEPFVSKMVINRDRTMEVAGPSNTRVAQEVNGKPQSEIFSSVRALYGPRVNDEASLLTAMLARRGISTQYQRMNYIRTMLMEPRAVLEWSKGADLPDSARRSTIGGWGLQNRY